MSVAVNTCRHVEARSTSARHRQPYRQLRDRPQVGPPLLVNVDDLLVQYRLYLQWCADNGHPAQIHRGQVSAWIAAMLDGGAQPTTAAARLAGVRPFSKWLAAEGEIDSGSGLRALIRRARARHFGTAGIRPRWRSGCRRRSSASVIRHRRPRWHWRRHAAVC